MARKNLEEFSEEELSIIEKYNKKIKKAGLGIIIPAILFSVMSINAGEFIDKYTNVPFKVYKSLGGTDRKKYHELVFICSLAEIVCMTLYNYGLVKSIYEKNMEDEIENLMEDEKKRI